MMDPNALREHLTQLHDELKGAKQVDPESAPLLSEIMQDIKRLMTPSTEAHSGPISTAESLPDRLEKIAVLFEADHPTLAASSRRLIDLLGKVGL
jgi:hypothetical protein